ncbi:response regulator receiver domain [Candidatus Poriferisodalis sp.]|uniref:response regulator receiver domain n=1 Tax=Candidatus Poriferisodalis sp. TaxID=3101277 RepID=UPI003AF7A644
MTAISDYFRTALLIDDRVAADYGPLERLQNRFVEDTGRDPALGLVAPPEEDETPVQPAQLVRAFLASGVVCSVLEAADSETVLVQQVLQGAQIADLLILDWLIDGDDSATVEAIDAVATQYPERLTVIVVFTGAHSLSGVVQRLIDAAEFESVDDCIVRREHTVVLVFGKPGPQLTGGEDRRQPDVDYERLPRMIRDDLELVFKGLMPEFAFSGINALRESAPRILATFNSELDAGALIHRALLPDPDEAAAQFIRLLSGDMELALRDAEMSSIWDIDASSDPLARATASGDAGPLAAKLRRSPRVAVGLQKLNDDELVRQAISQGLAGTGLGDSAVTEASADLAAAMTDAGPSNEKLAVLIDSNGFGGAPPRLELGVVLRREPTAEELQQAGHDAGQHMWLCVQPVCDSVRLREPRAFPLVPVLVDADTPKAMICPPDGAPTGISFVTHLHQLEQVRFAPNIAEAVVAQGSPPNWHFTDEDGIRYRVVTRLRSDLAAQVVHTLGSAATRIGTDQSEWLRRRARS